MSHSHWSWRASSALPLAVLVSALSLGARPASPPTDPTVEFVLGGSVQMEDAGSISINVQLSAPAVQQVTVPFTISGTAVQGGDYTIDASPVVIQPGFSSGSIPLTIIDDFTPEGAETIVLSLGTPTNAVVGPLDHHMVVIAPSDQLLYGKVPRAQSMLPLFYAPESIAFPSTRLGTSANAVQVLVRNLTGNTLTLTAADLIGRDARHFSVQPESPLPLVLPHLGSTTLTVDFDPTQGGLLSATLRLQQSPFAIVAMEIPVTGVGIGPTHGELLVNCGGGKFKDEITGEIWVKDYGHTGPSLVVNNTIGEINAPANRHLYRSARAGLFTYDFELPNGTYDVSLHFAELEMTAAGQRVFDVTAEGQPIITGLDLFAVAGPDTAYVQTYRITLTDGVLSLGFTATTNVAIVNAIEARSVGVFQVSPTTLDFGVLAPGQVESLPLTLENVSLHPVHLDSLQIELLTGDASEFVLDINGTQYPGSSQTLNYVLDLTLGANEQVIAQMTYSPLEHAVNDLRLHFGGDFGPEQLVDVHGDAGFGGGYLHTVIVVEPVIVDFDMTGEEDVLLNGSDSHTHEPGKSIVGWEWRENGGFLSSLEQDLVSFPVGPHTVELKIFDDNSPQNTLAGTADFEVRPVTAVPGVLALYYPATLPATATSLLDAVPANAEYAEILPNLHVDNETGIGGSGLQTNTMVRLRAAFEVPFGRGYEFSVSGGVAYRLEVDGFSFQGPATLSQGTHTLEVRWAVDTLVELPLDVQVAVDGGGFGPFTPSELTHDQLAVPPVINTMPPQGISQGGNQIVVSGFGFFPRNQVVVHWGGMLITESSFTSWSATELQFLSPPGTGILAVTVETPHGISNAKNFEYLTSGPIPVLFTDGPITSYSQPTAMAWGPDLRLYVASRNGTIRAYTFNEDYTVQSFTQYAGVSPLSNDEIMGLAFNPWDPPGTIKIYVAHTEMYAQGGGAFTGPAPYPGQISVLTGPNFDNPVPLITNLPTSNHDHGPNGMLFDNNGDLLFNLGGNTNAGVKHPQMGDLPESPLTGATIKAELSRGVEFNGDLLWIETATGLVNMDQVFGDIVDLAPGRHVYVHAAGVRNGFDLLLTTWGFLYCSDNGPNGGFGVASTGPNTQTGTHPTDSDEVLLIEFDNYYGHPNRNRGRFVPLQNVYLSTSAAAQAGFTKHLKTLASSQNGIFEYRADTFLGAMRGELLVQKWNSQATRCKLSADKRAVTSSSTLPNAIKGLNIRQGPGGAIISGDYQGNRVRTFIPNDSGVFGLTVYDVHPWRAPASGGTPFVIGGENFGTLANTSVWFDGNLATLTAVTSKRIYGIVPAQANPTQNLVHITVNVAGVERIHQNSFLYLPTLVGKWNGNWTIGTNMPGSIGEVASGVINGVLYVVGESNDSTFAYNFVTKTWSSNLTKRPQKGNHHSAEVYNGKWYLIGGLGAGQGKVQIYDPVANSWTNGTDMPWAGGSVCTALIGGKIYAAGGIVGNTTVDNCAVYDIAANTWTPLASMPFQKGRNHAATGTDGVKMYVFGGRGIGSGPNNVVANGFDHVQIYDPATDTWTASFDPGSTLAPLPIGRGGTGKAVFYKGEFYVIGGETLNGPGAQPGNVYNRVDVYNPVTNTWRLEAKMPTARHGIFPVIYQGKIYVAGGGIDSGFSNSNVFEVFSRQ